MIRNILSHVSLLVIFSIIPHPWSSAIVFIASALYSVFRSLDAFKIGYQIDFREVLNQVPLALILRFAFGFEFAFLSTATNSCLIFVAYFTFFELNKAALQMAIVIDALLIVITSKFERMKNHTENIRYALLIILHWIFIGFEARPLLYVGGVAMFPEISSVLLNIDYSLSDLQLLYNLLNNWIDFLIGLLCAAHFSSWGLWVGKIYGIVRILNAIYESKSEAKRFVPSRYVVYGLGYVIFLITDQKLSVFYYFFVLERPEQNCIYIPYSLIFVPPFNLNSMT